MSAPEQDRPERPGYVALSIAEQAAADGELRQVAQLQGEVARLRTWPGLMSLLAEHYPPDVMDGLSGDPGPQIVALTRVVDELRRESEQVDDVTDRGQPEPHIDTGETS